MEQCTSKIEVMIKVGSVCLRLETQKWNVCWTVKLPLKCVTSQEGSSSESRKSSFQQAQIPETKGTDHFSPEQGRLGKHLKRVDRHTSMGPSGVNPQVRRELASVTTRSLSIFFEMSCQLREFCEDWKKANMLLFLKKYRRNTWRTTNWTPQSPRNWWRKSSCIAFPNTWRTAVWFVAVSIREHHA